MAERHGILVLNQVSAAGLSRLPAELYRVGKDVADPVAILVRSADLHGTEIAATVRAIGRAGVGTDNIPVDAMSRRGVPVFNAPGANANAVKELVLAGMLLAARRLAPALGFVGALDAQFLKGAEARGMVQLKGHRSVGGMRASIYNAMPIEGVQALVGYLREFEAEHG